MTKKQPTEQPIEHPVTMWEVKEHIDKIAPVEVVKQTDKTVWVKRLKVYVTKNNENFSIERYLKDSRFYDTWESAHEYLLNIARLKVESKKQQLNNAQSRLNEIAIMKPPIAES